MCLCREEALATKRLVDFWIGGEDRKKKYRDINDKLEMNVTWYVPDQIGVSLKMLRRGCTRLSSMMITVISIDNSTS